MIASFQTISTDDHLLCKISIPEVDYQNPMDFVCVVDVSGSMQQNAVLKNEENKEEDHGFEIIDIVIQAVRALISNLNEKDRLSVVLFSSKAKLLFPLTEMDENGKRKANKALSKISPDGSTNLWAGIELGLDQLRLRKENKKLGALMVLTDGEPNVEPEGGIINQVKMYLDRNYYVRENTLISTFGFGYSLDSALLREISEIGQGSYSFIPESGLVGSVLVNHVANIRCTGIWGAKIQVGNQEINVGNVLYGQDRDVVIQRKSIKENSTYLTMNVSFKQFTEERLARKFKFTRNVDTRQTPTNEQSLEVLVQLQRMKLISAIEDGMNSVLTTGNCSEAQEIVKKAIEEVSESEVSEDPRVLGYLEDLTTQITYAFSREDWYTKWGIHYLPSLSYAHRMQQCNNFKDAGVQLYGGKMFKHYQSLAEDAFLNLPAIERRVSFPPIIGNSNHQPLPQQMNAYYNQAGGCFSGGSTVLMADGTKKRVDHVRKGDVVQTPFGHSEILCVVINQFNPSVVKNVKCKRLNGGLVITPYHPVRVDGKWQFPCSLDLQSCQKLQPVDVKYHNKMYDFVLKAGHIMIINGVECVTLGHGIQEDVVHHQYFGSNAVVNDLIKITGWKEGAVVINWNQVTRSSSNLEVVSITALS